MLVPNYTIEQVKDLLNKRPIDTSENDLKGVFELVGLQIKEYQNTSKGWVEFEIHHQCTHVITYREQTNNRLATFSHRFVNISDCDGLSMAIKSTKELIVMTLNFFMNRLRIHHEGLCYSDDYFESTETELLTLVDAMFPILNEK